MERTITYHSMPGNTHLVRIAMLLYVFVFTTIRSLGQQAMLPLTAADGNSMAVALDSVRLTRHGDGQVGLSMSFCLIGRLGRGEQVMLVPRLQHGGETAVFTPIAVYGRWAYYHSVRSGGDGQQLQYRDREVGTFGQYSQTVGYEPWMSHASLIVEVVRTDGCGNAVSSGERTLLRPTEQVTQRQDEGWTDVKSDRLRGTAYVVFPVARTEVLPDFGDNQRELGRLCHVIDSLRRDPGVQLNHISICGYASPEGSYDSNERLARDRTHSLGLYLSEHCGLPLGDITMTHVAEDWQGLRRYVDASSMRERERLLAIIDSQQDPDEKLAQVARTMPAVYRRLCDEVFPRLRHTDYEIDYTRRTVTEHAGRLHTDTLRRLAFDTVAAAPAAMPARRFRDYRARLAVKTNLLYDLAVAPNIELEVPLGRQQRWSIMAEYCNPWWRWDRKSQSYEVQEAGLELRRWLAPRCSGGRPSLCGHLLGLYGAWAKFDLENKDVGDQGEVISAGLTYGYAWPIARHWNIEASVSAGVVWGNRRHYNAEFESTHLIYKYTKNLFYAGPTKLKLSLVWLIGSKKGGGR